MTLHLDRRRFLGASASVAAIGVASLPLSRTAMATSQGPATLTVERRTISVLGRPASVFGIAGPGGKPGLVIEPGERFLVDLVNRSGEETTIHWHGQVPPPAQDGVAGPDHPVIPDGGRHAYDFPARPGTHWMHSHHGLQEQMLMAAPLVVRTEEDRKADAQEVTVLLHDFTFKDPREVLGGLTSGMTMINAESAGHGHGGHGDHGGADLNDVEYDAYLANDRTLEDPQVITAERNGRVRLRIINGATATAFHIDLGRLTGTVLAVDGNPVKPVTGSRFGLVMGQRIDLMVQMPSGGGAFPVLALREGERQRTGIVLATPGATVAKVASIGSSAAPAVDLALERRLSAMTPLTTRRTDTTLKLRLTGTMMPYLWSIDGRTYGKHVPSRVETGQRVAVEMTNASGMAHPMHLHGHHFQVVALNGSRLDGAVRDTVLVPDKGSVTIAFDADNPGRWPLHCHNLFHMATGMMTEIVYGPAT